MSWTTYSFFLFNNEHAHLKPLCGAVHYYNRYSVHYSFTLFLNISVILSQLWDLQLKWQRASNKRLTVNFLFIFYSRQFCPHLKQRRPYVEYYTALTTIQTFFPILFQFFTNKLNKKINNSLAHEENNWYTHSSAKYALESEQNSAETEAEMHSSQNYSLHAGKKIARKKSKYYVLFTVDYGYLLSKPKIELFFFIEKRRRKICYYRPSDSATDTYNSYNSSLDASRV